MASDKIRIVPQELYGRCVMSWFGTHKTRDSSHGYCIRCWARLVRKM